MVEYGNDIEKVTNVLKKHPNGISVLNISREADTSWQAAKKVLIKLQAENKVKLIKGKTNPFDKWCKT